jgi:hypothetical protein
METNHPVKTNEKMASDNSEALIIKHPKPPRRTFRKKLPPPRQLHISKPDYAYPPDADKRAKYLAILKGIEEEEEYVKNNPQLRQRRRPSKPKPNYLQKPRRNVRRNSGSGVKISIDGLMKSKRGIQRSRRELPSGDNLCIVL